METTGPPMSAQMTTQLSVIVNYVNNSEGGGSQAKGSKKVQPFHFLFNSPFLYPAPTSAIQPDRLDAAASCTIPHPPTYRHTPTNPTQNDSGQARRHP